jgi:hypothetical protein
MHLCPLRCGRMIQGHVCSDCLRALQVEVYGKRICAIAFGKHRSRQVGKHVSKFKYTTIRVRTDVLKALASAADTSEARCAMGVRMPGSAPLQGTPKLVQDGINQLTREAQRVRCEEAKEQQR